MDGGEGQEEQGGMKAWLDSSLHGRPGGEMDVAC